MLTSCARLPTLLGMPRGCHDRHVIMMTHPCFRVLKLSFPYHIMMVHHAGPWTTLQQIRAQNAEALVTYLHHKVPELALMSEPQL